MEHARIVLLQRRVGSRGEWKTRTARLEYPARGGWRKMDAAHAGFYLPAIEERGNFLSRYCRPFDRGNARRICRKVTLNRIHLVPSFRKLSLLRWGLLVLTLGGTLSESFSAAQFRVGTGTTDLQADDAMVIGGSILPHFAKGQEGKLRAVAIVVSDATDHRVAV